MDALVNFKAFAYRLAAAALRVGVVLMIALPFVVLATRPWLNGDQIANESSGKRPSAVSFRRTQIVNDADGAVVTGATSTSCTEIAIKSKLTTDAFIFFASMSTSGGHTAAGCEAYDIGAANLWPLDAGESFVTRMPANPDGSSLWGLCYIASGAVGTEYIYISCLEQ